jgi:CHASE2 domain-containing sensor protein
MVGGDRSSCGEQYMRKRLLPTYPQLRDRALATYSGTKRLFKKAGKTLKGWFWAAPASIAHHIRQNLVIGLTVVILVSFFQNMEFVRVARESSLDWIISMNRGLGVEKDSDFRPFYWFDIDERTYEKWGEPLYIPRDKLAHLLGAAAQLKPSLIIVDVELDKALGNEDTQLIRAIQELTASTNPPSIIFLRNFRAMETGSGEVVPTPKSSFVESQIPKGFPDYWASPLFEKSHDGEIRRWRFWQSACGKNGSPIIIPSVQLQALSILSKKPGEEGLNQTLARSTKITNCQDEPEITTKTVSVGGKTFSTSGNAPFKLHILYSFPWKLDTGEARPEVSFAGQQVKLLNVIPAYAITEGQLPIKAVEKSVVVIGASFNDSRDIHMTPLGAMPGSLIIMNAIHSVLQHGEMRPPPLWQRLAENLVLLIGVSLILVRFPSLIGSIIAVVVILILLVPITFVMYRKGVWLDFALPIIAIKLYQFIDQYRETPRTKKGTTHE